MHKVEKFRKLRELVRGGMSQTEAAQAVGVGSGTASRWIRQTTPRGERRAARNGKRQTEIALSEVQRENARRILNSLAGGHVVKAEAGPTEDELLAAYVCKGGASDEVIKTACAGVTWKDMRRATRNARLQLRAEIQAGFERCDARERYVRGRFVIARQKPRENDLYALGVAA